VQLAALLFQPAAGLFAQGAADRALQHPSPTAALQPDWQKYSRLAGRVVGGAGVGAAGLADAAKGHYTAAVEAMALAEQCIAQ
jgi:hypothetical protein